MGVDPAVFTFVNSILKSMTLVYLLHLLHGVHHSAIVSAAAVRLTIE